MALWKPFKGSRADLDAVQKHDGYVYFCDDGALFFDYADSNGNLQRKQINAKDAETILGKSLEEIKKSIDYNDLINQPTNLAYIDSTNNENITDVVTPGGGSASIDVTASVGQTIVVEEVDADGKPTKWKAAEYQPRTHWENGTKEVETLAEAAFTGSLDSSIGAYAYTAFGMFTLKEGHQYKVVFDGVEYSGLEARVATLSGITAVAVGNFSMVGGGGADIPFVAVNMTNGYAGFILFDGNEHTAQIFEIVEDFHKIPKKFVPTFEEMSTEETVILPETTGEVDAEIGGVLLPDISLEAGKEYTVKYNGIEFVSNCIDFEGVIMIGNVPLLTETGDNGQPFVMLFEGEWVCLPFDGSTSVTLSIKDVVFTPIPVQCVTNALPYYIEVTGRGTEDDPYVCHDTVTNVESMYRSGRSLVVRATQVLENGNTFEFLFQLALRVSKSGIAGIYGFSIMSPYSDFVENAYSKFVLTSQDDGTFAVSTRGISG